MKDEKFKPLNEKGFVFIGGDGRPYMCAMWGDNPWLFYWHAENHWVTMKQVTQTEIWRMPKNLTDAEQDVYRKKHEEWESRMTG